MKTELEAREVGEFSLCHVGKWVDGHSFAYQRENGCRNINVWRYLKLNRYKSCIYTYINLKLAGTLKNGAINIVQGFCCKKKKLIKILMTSLQTKNGFNFHLTNIHFLN